jgi:dolichol-phosphate mannosyltransferase
MLLEGQERRMSQHAHNMSSLVPVVSLVVPVFNEEEVLPTFYQRAKATLNSIPDCRHELIFVDDGSRDRSPQLLRKLAANDDCVVVVKLSRNFGHQVAITAGLDMAQGDTVVVIDADLQDPPEVIQEFVAKWREGYDVVYAIRKRRDGETWMKLATAKYFYRLLRFLTKTEIPADVGDFRLLSRRAAAALRGLREHDRFVRGLVSWIGFEQIGVYYERDRRYAGSTKYSWRKMIAFATDALTSFSTAPLRLATWLGYATAFAAVLYLASVIVQWWVGITVQGWATIMVGLLFVGSVQLICLGIIGEYIGRVFVATKNRPLYLVDRVVRDGVEYQLAGQDSIPIQVAHSAEYPDHSMAHSAAPNS